jgi:hypothetical protein
VSFLACSEASVELNETDVTGVKSNRYIEITARPIDPEFERKKEEYAQALRKVEAGNSYSINESFWDKMHASIEAV